MKFLLYEAIIILPYAPVIGQVSAMTDVWIAALSAFVLLVFTSSFVNMLDIEKTKRALWEVYARFYDSLLSFYPYAELVELVSDRSAGHIREGALVADIGCGTGNVTVCLLQNHRHITVDAVEPSGAMLRRAKKKLEKVRTTNTVRYSEDDALGYLRALPDASLDVIVMCNVLYTITDRKKFWKHVKRTLKPGGVAVMTNSDRVGVMPLVRHHLRHARFTALLDPRLAGVAVIDNLISQLAMSNSFIFSPQSHLEAETAAAGLEVRDTLRCYGGADDGVNLLFTVHRP
jgi:ubiquinone/menaquinone biosynthesis C-methylase UbiE